MKTFKEYLYEEETGFNDTSALTPNASQFDDKSIDAMSQGILAGIKQLPPEYQANAEQLIVRDAEGNVDGDETMMKMFAGLGQIAVQLYEVFEKITSQMEALIKTPEFAKQYPDPAEQQKLIKDVADMRSQMPELKAAADKGKAASDQFQNTMRPEIDRRANTAFKNKTGLDMVRGGAGQKTNIGTDSNNPGGAVGSERGYAGESADDKLLQKMLMIAGLG